MALRPEVPSRARLRNQGIQPSLWGQGHPLRLPSALTAARPFKGGVQELASQSAATALGH